MFSCVVATDVKAWSGDANRLGVTEHWVTKLTGFLGGELAEAAFTPANWVSARGRITCLEHFPQVPQSKTILQYLLKVPNVDYISSIFELKAELLFDLYTRYCPDRLLSYGLMVPQQLLTISMQLQYPSITVIPSVGQHSAVCASVTLPLLLSYFSQDTIELHQIKTCSYITIYQNFTFQTTLSYLDKKLNIRISVLKNFSGHDAWLCCFFSLCPKITVLSFSLEVYILQKKQI